MSLKKGNRVTHPIRAEWGLGEVLEDANEEKVRVFFVGAGEKTISLKHVTLDYIPKDDAAHPVLDNLRAPAESGHIRYQSLPASVEKFLKRFPQGFHGDRFAEEERDYKVRAHQLAQDLISKSELARLLSANDFEGIGAVKWTIATYFLFIIYPESYVFLKPTVTQNAAEISGFEINYRPALNWRTYESVLTFANYLKGELAELAPRDMIDVQSFIRCIAPGKL